MPTLPLAEDVLLPDEMRTLPPMPLPLDPADSIVVPAVLDDAPDITATSPEPPEDTDDVIVVLPLKPEGEDPDTTNTSPP